MNLAELVVRNADTHPEHPALVFGDNEISYGQYVQTAGRLAGALKKRGVVQGDRIIFYSRNNPEFFMAYTASAWIGAVFTPIHNGFRDSEMEYVASNASARLAIVEADLLDQYARFQSTFNGLPEEVVVLGTAQDSLPNPTGLCIESFSSFVSAANDAPAMANLTPDTPAMISYTSGSTSRPKPVLRSHGGETWNAETYREYWDLRSDDRALMSLPLSWVYGLSTLGQSLLAAGSTIEILTHFNPVTVVEAISRGKITLFGGTNTMYVKMLDVYGRHGGDFSSLRNCYIGGEPSNPAAVAHFESLINSRLWQGYAATEAAPVLLTNPKLDASAPPHTVGRLVPGAEIKLVDDLDLPVPAGEAGEALLRCPGAMLGYFRENQLTHSRVTEDGWFRSGDLLVERDGYYFVVGRKTDMIIRGGSNVAPAEVESALTSIEGIVDAVVFGIPDTEYGETVAAMVATGSSDYVPDDALTAALEEKLAKFKIPTRYFRNLDLPEGSTGKRDRRAVQAVALASLQTESSSPLGA